MRILLIFRKKNPLFFSIERVFGIILNTLQRLTQVETVMLQQKGVNLKNILFLFRNSRKKDAQDIFHVTGDVHYAVFGLPYQRRILTIHDCVFIELHEGLKKWALKKILLDWPVRYTKYITTISEKTKSEIVRISKCDPAKIRVIPDPVAEEFKYLQKEFNKAEPELLFLGSTVNKNLDRSIEAIKDISCRLRIVGRPTDVQRRALQENGIKHIIESGLTDEELAGRFAATDIVFFPSLYEGFGMPVIEGFKSGRVVLTSNISPMKEIAAGAACLVNPLEVDSIRNALKKLIDQDVYREQLIAKGFEVVEQYLPDRIAFQYFQLYEEVYKNICAE